MFYLYNFCKYIACFFSYYHASSLYIAKKKKKTCIYLINVILCKCFIWQNVVRQLFTNDNKEVKGHYQVHLNTFYWKSCFSSILSANKLLYFSILNIFLHFNQ